MTPAGHVKSDMKVDVGRQDVMQGIYAGPGKAFCGPKKYKCVLGMSTNIIILDAH